MNIDKKGKEDFKKKVLDVLTNEWQTTKAVADRLQTFSQRITPILYELFIDDKKIRRLRIKNKYLYWRLK